MLFSFVGIFFQVFFSFHGLIAPLIKDLFMFAPNQEKWLVHLQQMYGSWCGPCRILFLLYLLNSHLVKNVGVKALMCNKFMFPLPVIAELGAEEVIGCYVNIWRTKWKDYYELFPKHSLIHLAKRVSTRPGNVPS